MVAASLRARAEARGTTDLRERVRVRLAAVLDRNTDLDVAFLAQSTARAPTRERCLVVRIGSSRVHLLLARGSSDRRNPCPQCFDGRSVSLLSEAEQWAWQSGRAGEACDSPFAIEPLLEQIALIAEFILGFAEPDAVYSLDLLTGEIARWAFLPDHFCAHCAVETPSMAPRTAQLRESLPARSGKSRMIGLADYRLPERALVNPVCGAIGPRITRVYQEAITAPAFGQYMQRYDGARPRQVSWSGLSLRLDESRVAGMLEGLERQAGQYPPARAPVRESFRGLAGRAMHPGLCFEYNRDSYERPLNLTRFDEDLEIDWVWGCSLFSGDPLLVPQQLVYYTRHIEDSEPKLIDNNSSGCALGSCLEEAILKGLLELIERDAFVIGWLRKLAYPRIDLTGCEDRRMNLIMDRLDYLNFDVALLDGRLDIACPVVIAVARRRDDEIGAVAVGSCASPDATEAMRGALLEAATSIVELPRLFLADEERIRALAADHYRVRTVSDHQLLYALPEMAHQTRWMDASPVRKRPADGDESGYHPGDIAQNLRHLLAQLRALGLKEAVFVDQTTREQRLLGLVTVRVIVPGLAPIDFGHPRNRAEHLPRLRSAPVAAGLAAGGALNALPHPFP